MWKVGLDKKFGPNLVYATVSSSFKSGGFSGINTTLQSQLSPYGPEKVIAYEVGACCPSAQDPAHQRRGLLVRLPRRQETNYVNTFAGALAQMTNVPRARVRGFELDATWQATRNLSFQASTTYLDARVTRWPDAGIDAGGVAVSTDISGARLAMRPPGRAMQEPTSIGWAVGSPVPHRRHECARIYSGRILGLDPSSAVPGYAGQRATGIKAADDKWRVSLWMRNMADRIPASAFVGSSLFVRIERDAAHGGAFRAGQLLITRAQPHPAPASPASLRRVGPEVLQETVPCNLPTIEYDARLAGLVRRGETNARELADLALAALARVNPAIGAVVETWPEDVPALIDRRPPGPLFRGCRS
jgi:hypothetical protein